MNRLVPLLVACGLVFAAGPLYGDTIEAFGAPNSYLPERLVRVEELFVDEYDWALNLGFLWRVSERWSVGGVYRQGMEVDIGSRVFAGEALVGDFGWPDHNKVFDSHPRRLVGPILHHLVTARGAARAYAAASCRTSRSSWPHLSWSM